MQKKKSKPDFLMKSLPVFSMFFFWSAVSQWQWQFHPAKEVPFCPEHLGEADSAV